MSVIISWSTALVALVWLLETVVSRRRTRERSEVKGAMARVSYLSAIIPLLFPTLVIAAVFLGVGQLPPSLIALPFQFVGLLLAIGAEVVIARARMELGDQQTEGVEVWAEQRLIRRGLYAFVRHPIYLGTLALGLGLGLGLWSWALLLADLIVALPLFYWLASQEERLLAERFGHDYQEYRARVPMLSPWPRPTKVGSEAVKQPDVAEQE
ncbi:MAG: methyltransferase family protein [Chloroflexota bacterium]|jgi:protein-S-isoprenylcysteine O-methyltransferase Ste14